MLGKSQGSPLDCQGMVLRGSLARRNSSRRCMKLGFLFTYTFARRAGGGGILGRWRFAC
jgi:hypothetical protein